MVESAPATPAAASTKKGKAKGAKKASVKKPIHPLYADMVVAALEALKGHKGSSRQAVLKYILANFKVGDEKKAGVRVKLAVRRGIASGALKQVKGTGALGSFKIASDDDKPKKAATKKPKAAKKPAAKTATKKPAAKKATKKSVAKKPSPKKAAKKPAAKKAAKKPAKK